MSKKKYEICGCVEEKDGFVGICKMSGCEPESDECKKYMSENAYYIYKEIKL